MSPSRDELRAQANHQNLSQYQQQRQDRDEAIDSNPGLIRLGDRDPSTGVEQVLYQNGGQALAGVRTFNASLSTTSPVRTSKAANSSVMAMDSKSYLDVEAPGPTTIEQYYAKILFFVVQNGQRNFYIGGDRPKPIKILSLPETYSFGQGFITNTGKNIDNWIVSVSYNTGLDYNTSTIQVVKPRNNGWTVTDRRVNDLFYLGNGFWTMPADDPMFPYWTLESNDLYLPGASFSYSTDDGTTSSYTYPDADYNTKEPTLDAILNNSTPGTAQYVAPFYSFKFPTYYTFGDLMNITGTYNESYDFHKTSSNENQINKVVVANCNAVTISFSACNGQVYEHFGSATYSQNYNGQSLGAQSQVNDSESITDSCHVAIMPDLIKNSTNNVSRTGTISGSSQTGTSSVTVSGELCFPGLLSNTTKEAIYSKQFFSSESDIEVTVHPSTAYYIDANGNETEILSNLGFTSLIFISPAYSNLVNANFYKIDTTDSRNTFVDPNNFVYVEKYDLLSTTASAPPQEIKTKIYPLPTSGNNFTVLSASYFPKSQ